MQILYIYDIKARDRKEFNRVKRVFYYHLGRLGLAKDSFRTKSVIIADEGKERALDSFFSRFRGSAEVYKVYAGSIESL